MYDKASLQVDAMLAEKPTADDVKNMRPLFHALGQSDQTVLNRKASTVALRMQKGNLYLPITVEGKQAGYILDTGANFSLLSESEAKRLGLVIRNVNTQIGDSSGAHLGTRVAIAKEFRLAGLHLKNVAFGILPDTQPPFAGLPRASAVFSVSLFCWRCEPCVGNRRGLLLSGLIRSRNTFPVQTYASSNPFPSRKWFFSTKYSVSLSIPGPSTRY
jgi:hypothetical protein